MSSHPANTLSRRRFLAGAATLGAASRLPLQAATNWKMRLSCSTIAFGDLPVDKACERIAELGYEAVDFWAPNWCDHLQVLQDKYGASGTKELLKKNNLKLYAFSVYGPGYQKHAKLLGEAGGGVAVHGSRTGLPEDVTAEMKKYLESLKPEIELAEKYDSYIAVENHGNALLHSPDSFKAFVDLNRHPRVGIAVAPYHIQKTGMPVEKVIEIVGDQLFFFYAWQNGEGMDQMPGVGPADFTPWLAALAKINYKWYVNPFMHHQPAADRMSAALAKSNDYLEKCYSNI